MRWNQKFVFAYVKSSFDRSDQRILWATFGKETIKFQWNLYNNSQKTRYEARTHLIEHCFDSIRICLTFRFNASHQHTLNEFEDSHDIQICPRRYLIKSFCSLKINLPDNFNDFDLLAKYFQTEQFRWTNLFSEFVNGNPLKKYICTNRKFVDGFR